MFRILIYPSSGACDCVVELPHRSFCSQSHQISKSQRTENKTTDVVIHQHSRKLSLLGILISETRWAHKKWNKIESYIKLVFYSSTITMIHGPINIKFLPGIFIFLELRKWPPVSPSLRKAACHNIKPQLNCGLPTGIFMAAVSRFFRQLWRETFSSQFWIIIKRVNRKFACVKDHLDVTQSHNVYQCLHLHKTHPFAMIHYCKYWYTLWVLHQRVWFIQRLQCVLLKVTYNRNIWQANWYSRIHSNETSETQSNWR